MRYAKKIIQTEYNPNNLKDRYARLPSAIYCEINDNDNVIRRIDLRIYEQSLSLYQLDKFGNQVSFYHAESLTCGTFPKEENFEMFSPWASGEKYVVIDREEFESAWQAKGELFEDYSMIELWEPRIRPVQHLEYFKSIIKLDAVDLTKLYLPNIYYHEVDPNLRVLRRIDVRSYENSLTIVQLDKNPLMGYLCDESLNEGPFLKQAEVSKTRAKSKITEGEFLNVWDGALESYAGYDLIKAWEKTKYYN